jgi:membrane-bound lytic murein transglycosylase A
MPLSRWPGCASATVILVAGLLVGDIDAATARRSAPHGTGSEASAVKPSGAKLRASPAVKPRELPPPVPAPPGPLRIPDTQLEPVDWSELAGWADDDHAAAFKAFLTSCRPIVRAVRVPGETRAIYAGLRHVCHRALSAGPLDRKAAKAFFEANFRPARISRLGEAAGFLTGYYEPVVDGSRFPTGIFNVPIYRRPHDLVAPGSKPQTSGFPNTGQSMRRTSSGELVPYFDRGEILDGALDGRHLEICWIKDPTEALFIQIQGSARVRLEDGTMLRINYDAHNGYPYVPVGRVLIERKIIPREEMSMQRIREWMHDNPEAAEEVRRQNRSFVFFRIVGLTDDREAIGAQGVQLTAGRSIAVDKALHVYGTPFFIEAGIPITDDKRSTGFHRLMIGQDTGSAIVGPARADIYWGAGEVAGRLAGRLRHPGRFTMLIPRELDPVAAGAQMPLPPVKVPPPKPSSKAIVAAKAKAALEAQMAQEIKSDPTPNAKPATKPATKPGRSPAARTRAGSSLNGSTR